MSSNDINAFRLRLPRDERKHSWLPLLLDCYALIDFSVAQAIEQAEKSEKKLACHKGCAACCSQVIPLSTLECLGIKFYVQNILDPQHQAALHEKLNGPLATCLFNFAGCCAVYPLRPIACRRYLVCSRPCAKGEVPAVTRPADSLEPSREYLQQAIELTLPFYKEQNIPFKDNERGFEFYKRQNVQLSSAYANIIM
ncbi:MAG: YkgJ family cysteine cluster protein [Deltaproteobacteria bacterium]|jgi:hypothetical protein|nr:YkgJ family cysteine cluster protein [Deltaproteobacteria bacterium]